MKKKFTVVLSLATLLAATPVSPAFGNSYTGASSSSSASSSTSTGSSSSSDSSSSTDSSTTASNSNVSSGTNTEVSTGSGNTSQSNTSTGNVSSGTKSEAGTQSGHTSQSNNGAGNVSPEAKSETGTLSENNAQTNKGVGKDSSDVNSKTSADTKKDSHESRLGNEKNDFVSDFTNKSFESSFEEVTKLTQKINDFRSKVDQASYETYVKEQQAENVLFSSKKNTDYSSTITEVQQSLKTNPEDISLYVELALAYLASGDLKNAEETAKHLDAKVPESYISLLLQAELAENQGKSDEKQIYLKKAVENNPTSSIAQFKLGEALSQAGKYNEAVAYLSTAAALNPKNEIVFEELNKVFAKTKTPEIKTFVNGVVPKFEVKPFIENESTLIPARAISEALGANVEWNDTTKQVSIQHGNTTIVLTIDSNIAIVNGKEITIDAPAKIASGSTVLPLRFVSESLGAKVDWKAESQMIVISE